MKQVTEFMEKFVSRSEVNELLKNKKIVKINREYFLVSENAVNTEHHHSHDHYHNSIVSSGIPLGLTKENFVPSISLLEIISKKSKKKIVINEKAEWLFLCGRDVFGNSVVSYNDQKKGDLALVQNEKDENLGYGKVMEKISDSDHVVLKNMLDRGDFLRREKKN